ncbi:hypothetical protein K6V06_01335 [Cupriavidus sp. AU9028]|nr:hypothetical protein [Cupriavidus sp. AU9028]
MRAGARLVPLLAAAALAGGCASEPFPEAPPPPPPSEQMLMPPNVAGTPDPRACAADGMEDNALVGKTEAEAVALLKGCVYRIGQRDAQQFPGTMDFREERRTLGIAGGIVVWVKRG